MNKLDLMIDGKVVSNADVQMVVKTKIAGGGPTPPTWENYPEGAVWVEGDSLMKVKDGVAQPHVLKVGYNYSAFADVSNAYDPIGLANNRLRDFTTEDQNGNMTLLDAYITWAIERGFNAITFLMANGWFTSEGYMSYDRVQWANEPSKETFRLLEKMRARCVEMDVTLLLWWWGDEERHWTPNGIKGGTNGKLDRQIQDEFVRWFGNRGGIVCQRGFDLQEVGNVTAEQCGVWAKRLTDGFSYPLAVGARGYTHPNLTYDSLSSPNLDVRSLDVFSNKPMISEERFSYGKEVVWFDGSYVTLTTERTKELRDRCEERGISIMLGLHYGTPETDYPNHEILA